MKTDTIIDSIINGLNNIKSSYYKIETTYEPMGIVRERAFCYELYHQVRVVQSKTQYDNQITLNGEIDKRGHVHFEPKDRKNPDFVFHIPGEFEGNTVVIEVKGKLYNVIKDIETLYIFTQKYNYQIGLFLLYNHSYEELLGYISKRGNDFKKYVTNKIILLCKKDTYSDVELNNLKYAIESI